MCISGIASSGWRLRLATAGGPGAAGLDRGRLELRRPWADGTTHLLFDPVELLERLAALIPWPRINLILHHGVLASRAAGRSRLVQYGRAEGPAAEPNGCKADAPDIEARPQRPNLLWAVRMRRSLRLDVPLPGVAGAYA